MGNEKMKIENKMLRKVKAI